jgi:antitoxin ParD1/3/4
VVKLFTRIARLWRVGYPDSVTDERSGHIEVHLPEGLRAFVESRAAEEGFASAAEYIAELVRREELRVGHDLDDPEVLERLIVEGLESGPPIEMTPERWQKMREELNEEFRGRAAE